MTKQMLLAELDRLAIATRDSADPNIVAAASVIRALGASLADCSTPELCVLISEGHVKPMLARINAAACSGGRVQ